MKNFEYKSVEGSTPQKAFARAETLMKEGWTFSHQEIIFNPFTTRVCGLIFQHYDSTVRITFRKVIKQ